jgi:hypothetical protein
MWPRDPNAKPFASFAADERIPEWGVIPGPVITTLSTNLSGIRLISDNKMLKVGHLPAPQEGRPSI